MPPPVTSPRYPEHSRYQRPPPFTFHERLSTTTGNSLLFFIGESCGACRALKPLLHELLVQDQNVTVFEVDALHDAALAREFAVVHLPALFLFQEGQYHCRLQCMAKIEVLRQAITQALARPAEDPP